MAGRARRSGLGKGLDALFENRQEIQRETKEDKQEAEQTKGDRVVKVDINKLKPNDNQPRKNFDEEKIDELADSIREHGVIQPLIVRQSGEFYEIVAGERRYRAGRKVGLKTLPVIIREFTDEENMLVAIVENMQREDLNPIEEAEGIEQMINVYGLTQEEVSKTLGKSRPYITNALRLLKLPEEIRELVIEGIISQGHGRTLLAVESNRYRAELCRRIIDEGLSVRQLEKIIAHSKKRPATRKLKEKDPNIVAVEENLKQVFGTKVIIDKKKKKGQITFEFYNDDEMERIVDLLCKL